MDEERRRRWKAHCERMAEATYAIADWCEDPEMMGAYLELAGKWIQFAERGPGDRADFHYPSADRLSWLRN